MKLSITSANQVVRSFYGCLIASLTLLSLSGLGQSFEKLKSIKTTDTITFATVDRAGELYVVLNKGTIQKYDINGEMQFEMQHHLYPSIFDPRDGAKIFVYYRANQTYYILPPTLNKTTPGYKVDEAFAISPHLVCPSGDYNIIILDSADWSLKKVNTKTSTLVWEAPPNDDLKNTTIIYMRDYQNFLFLLNKNNEVLIYNSLGKYLRSIKEDTLTYFNFLGEEMYHLQKDKIKFFNLFTSATRYVAIPMVCDYALLTDERLFTITKNTINFFQFKP